MIPLGLCWIVAINAMMFTVGTCYSSALSKCLAMAYEQQNFFDSDLIVSDRPSISSIRKLGLHEEIPSRITAELTCVLLGDKTGASIERIRYDNRKSTEKMNTEVFCRWLTCEGKQPVTWNTLVVALRDGLKLRELARRLMDVIPPKNLNVSVDCMFSVPVLKYPITNPPDMYLLKHLNVNLFREIVSYSIKDFGTALLVDKDERKMSKVLTAHKQVYDIIFSILEQWLKGDGKIPVTWKTLISTLHDIKLKELADNVQKLIHSKVINTESLPFAHSEAILNMTMILKDMYRKQLSLNHFTYHGTGFPLINVTIRDSQKNEPFDLDEHFMISPRRWLITGQSHGNEILMWHITREWAKRAYCSSCQLLLRINLGQCKRKYHNLNSFLKDAYEKSFVDINKISKDIQREHGEGVCMILNCFRCKQLKRDFIYDVIYNGKLPNALCLIFSQLGEGSRHILGIGSLHTNISFLFDNLKVSAAEIEIGQCINSDMKHSWLGIVLKECRQPYLHIIITVTVENHYNPI